MGTDGFDLIVTGAGMAGLTAAASVARRGGRVAVLEKAADFGGSARLSGGMVWTAADPALLRAECPLADERLIVALRDDLPRLLDCIAATGAAIEGEAAVLGYGRGRRVDLESYLSSCVDTVIRTGGLVLSRSQMYELIDDGGAIRGARSLVGGDFAEHRAPWTMLATGGFQANRELLRRHVHTNADHLVLRSNRASTGDGLMAGLAAGATLSPGMAGFYGHLVAWPARTWEPGVFALLSQYHSADAALVDINGQLIPQRGSDHVNTQQVLMAPDARAVLVMDSALKAAQSPPTSEKALIDRFEIGRENGANAASADTLANLGRAIDGFGFAGGRLAAAIETHNADRVNGWPIAAPPFYALEVRPAITFTHGGLRIDPSARVLDGGGSPIPGLLAAGADAGGVFDVGYGGGLAAAGVFGLRAADQVTLAVA